MSGKSMIGAVLCGAIIGSAAAVAIVPCCSSRNRKKMMRYKNHMFKTMGTIANTINCIRK